MDLLVGVKALWPIFLVFVTGLFGLGGWVAIIRHQVNAHSTQLDPEKVTEFWLRFNEVKRTSDGLRIKRGGVRHKWIELPRESIVGVTYVPDSGKIKRSLGNNVATGVMLGTGVLALPAMALHIFGGKKTGLVVMKVRLDSGVEADVLFEADKRESTYNEFMKLLRT